MVVGPAGVQRPPITTSREASTAPGRSGTALQKRVAFCRNTELQERTSASPGFSSRSHKYLSS